MDQLQTVRQIEKREERKTVGPDRQRPSVADESSSDRRNRLSRIGTIRVATLRDDNLAVPQVHENGEAIDSVGKRCASAGSDQPGSRRRSRVEVLAVAVAYGCARGGFRPGAFDDGESAREVFTAGRGESREQRATRWALTRVDRR